MNGEPVQRVVLLQTSRLTLRRFTQADVDLLVELDADPEVMHFITGGLPTSRSEIADVILPFWLSYYQVSPFAGFWAAEERTGGDFVGWFHLRPREDRPSDEPELGYRLRRQSWGQGLATEGASALVDFAFTKAGVGRVVAETMLVHAASRRVMEKVGMKMVREFDSGWPYPIPGDQFGDVEYAIERRDWEIRRRVI